MAFHSMIAYIQCRAVRLRKALIFVVHSGSEVHCSVRQTSKIQYAKTESHRNAVKTVPVNWSRRYEVMKVMHGRGESAVFLNSERRCRRGHVPKET